MRGIVKNSLARLQRYAQTDVTYLIKGGFWLGVGHIAQIFGGVVVTIVLANTIEKNDLGLYQFVLATASILGAFTLTGLATSITTAVAKGDEGALRSGVRAKLKWNTFIVVASAIVAGYYFWQNDSILGISFLIVGALTPFIESFHLYQQYLIGKQEFQYNAYLSVIRKAIPALSIISTVLFFTQEPLQLVFVYFFSNTISMILLYKMTVWRYQPPLSENFSDTIRFSKHLSVMNLAGRIANNIDKILIFHHLGAVAVATYTIAQLPTKATGNSFSLLRSLALPKLAKRDLATLQETLPRKVRFLFLLAALLTVAYIFLAPFVFSIFFPDYLDAIIISQALALSLLFTPRMTYLHALTAHEKTNSLYIMQVALPALKLLLLYVLLPIYDIWGAVYAVLATDAIGSLIVYTLFKVHKTTSAS